MFYLCFIDVKYLPDHDQDRSGHVRVVTNRVLKYDLTLVGLLVLLCELKLLLSTRGLKLIC
jgi:hypothetical protein